MREIWVADSETDPFDGKTFVKSFVWGCYNGSEYHQFDTTKAFIEFITEIECIVYAHNGGKFDWHFILDYLEPWSPLQVINGRMARFSINKAEFRDSYNILPSPLSAFKKDEIDYRLFTKRNRKKPQNKRKIEEYLRSDCVYLYAYVKQFIDDYGLNLTFAGAAIKQWKKIANVELPVTTKDFFDSISPYYYGGRVECFELGVIERQLKVYDINSAYPNAMTHCHPYGETFEIGNILPKGEALNRAFIKLRGPSKGALPFRSKTGLEFPNDGETREFTITGWEYVAARETGALPWYEVLSVLTLPLTVEFNSYVDHFFALKVSAKKAGDRARYEFAKFFLNGLSGKFGANPEKYEEFTVVEPQFIEAAEACDDYKFCAELGPYALVSRPLPEEKHRYYNIAVIASITGFVRAQLWRAIKQSKGVVYCDTDSIICADAGALEIHPTQLGRWDLEADCVRGAIAGKKLYALEKVDGKFKTASKGVRLKADEIFRIAGGEQIEYFPQNPSFSIKTGTRFVSRKINRKA